MPDSLESRLVAAEARRREAASEVTELLARILGRAGVRLIEAESQGGGRWTLAVAIDGPVVEPVAQPAAEPAPEAAPPPPSPAKAPLEVPAPPAAWPVMEDSENPVPPVPLIDPAPIEQEAQAAPRPEPIAEPADVGGLDLPPLPTLDDVARPPAEAAPKASEDDQAEDPLLAPLPALPDFQEPAAAPSASPVIESQETAAEPLPPGPVRDDGMGDALLPPLPPLTLMDDDDDGADAPAVAGRATAELQPGPATTLPPAPPLPPPPAEPADLATLLQNGSKELRVKPASGKRRNPFKQSSTDPRSRAERLARTLVSDMIAYGRERHGTALQQGVAAIRAEFEADIDTARAEYYAQVDEAATPERDEIFRKAVNDLLGNGQPVI